jgi:tetratricopeptide (TPR) repeat protein
MRAVHRRVALAVLFIVLAGLADPDPPENALARGNLLFEKDEVEAALDAYARGWREGGSKAAGVLAYNAGTCALRLGRLPEALLWYRRAEAALPGDPWLRENLAFTRHALGEPPEDGPAWERSLVFLGVASSWAALLLVVLRRRPPRGLLLLLAFLSCVLFIAGRAGTLPLRFGPRAAVLLLPCAGRPAGSELRVRSLDGGGWRIVGEESGARCPAEAVGLVRP